MSDRRESGAAGHAAGSRLPSLGALDRAIVAAAPLLIQLFDAESGAGTEANDAAARITGSSVAELRAMNFRAIASWRESGLLVAAEEALRSHAEQKLDVHVTTTAGNEVWMDCRLVSVEIDGRQHLLLVANDISARVQADAERQRLTAAVEQSAESILITDIAGTIQYANPAFERLSGFTAEEVRGQNPRMLKSGRQDAEFYRAMWDVLAAGETWSGRLINLTKGGLEYPVEATIFPLIDRGGLLAGYVGLGRDVARERLLESELLTAQKMEAIGNLAGGVAHDFNNLLTVIKSYADRLLEKVERASADEEDLHEIVSAADRATVLTRQLLAFGRRQMLDERLLGVNSVVTGLESMLHRLIPETIRWRMVRDPNLGTIRADAGQLEQVIVNLAVNARDAMLDGGLLTITTANIDLHAGADSTGTLINAGPMVMIGVTDTGIGMDEATKERIFEPFFTTKDAGRGTGLGLSTVYGIVRQSGGYLFVRSEPEKGATFEVYFPRVDGEPERPAAARSPERSLRGAERLLLVEDDDGVRRVAARTLRTLGYDVAEARDGQDGLVRALALEQAPDLLVTDLVMPKMNGRQLAAALRLRWPALRVLLMSGYAADPAMSDAPTTLEATILTKPFDMRTLAIKVREALDGRATAT